MSKSTDNVMAAAGELPSSGLAGRAQALRQNKEFERFWKFAVVGIIGAVIDYGTYTLLNTTGVLDSFSWRTPFGFTLSGLGLAGAIAFALAVTSNFIWNRYWTYPDSRSKPILLQIVTFFLINIVGLVIRIPIIELLTAPIAHTVQSILPSLGEGTARWVGETGSWGLAVVIAMFWNFFVNRYWTYNDVE